MNIVIPMAGLGSRFSKSGFSLPKPLINVINKPMYRHAVDCLPLHLASNLVFILRDDHYTAEIEKDIRFNYQHAHYSIVKLGEVTDGQAETILKSAAYLDLQRPTLIHNCDTWFTGNFEWSEILKQDVDGALVLFPSNEERWSYAKLDHINQYIIDVQEKKVISTHASTGTYFFNDTSLLLEIIEHNIKQNIRHSQEFYLSTVYQSMLKFRTKIIPLWAERIMCFGTPQDLVASLNEILVQQITAKGTIND